MERCLCEYCEVPLTTDNAIILNDICNKCDEKQKIMMMKYECKIKIEQELLEELENNLERL